MTTTPVTETNQFFKKCPLWTQSRVYIAYHLSHHQKLEYMYSTCGYIYVCAFHVPCRSAATCMYTSWGFDYMYIYSSYQGFILDPASAAPFSVINWFFGIFEKIRRSKIRSFRRNRRKKCIHKKRTDVENERKTPAQRNPQEKRKKSILFSGPTKKYPYR